MQRTCTANGSRLPWLLYCFFIFFHYSRHCHAFMHHLMRFCLIFSSFFFSVNSVHWTLNTQYWAIVAPIHGDYFYASLFVLFSLLLFLSTYFFFLYRGRMRPNVCYAWKILEFNTNDIDALVKPARFKMTLCVPVFNKLYSRISFFPYATNCGAAFKNNCLCELWVHLCVKLVRVALKIWNRMNRIFCSKEEERKRKRERGRERNSILGQFNTHECMLCAALRRFTY